jgi:heat-inducible transcriptional repressor
MLTERQLEVVLSVVYEYIRSGESVGSRTVSRRYLTGHSSATIRNEMSDLEEMGFLKQTHTSSGRIPTTLGYRLYVDSVLQRAAGRHTKEWMAKKLNDHQKGIEGALETSSELLSRISNYVGVAALAPLEAVKFQHVDFVRVGESNVLMLVVLQGGLVHQKMIKMPWDISQDNLDDLSQQVNHLAGRSWTEVKKALQTYMKRELSGYREAYEGALRELEGIVTAPSMKVFTGSMSKMFELPDFQDISRMQALYSFIEEENNMAELINSCSKDGLNVMIGDENKFPAMKKASFVAATTTADGQRATVGIIGPERMDYEKAFATIDKVLQTLEPGSETEGKDNE